MNKNTNNASRSNAVLTLISVLVIAAFVIAGACATIPYLNQHTQDKAMRNGEVEPTVSFLARESGVSVDDYLAQYGLAVGEEVNEDTTLSDMVQNMTIGNYNNYMAAYGNTIDIEQFSDAVTEDTLYKDFMAMPVETVLGTDTFNATKEAYNMGDEITGDMSWEDFNNAAYTYALQANDATAAGATE